MSTPQLHLTAPAGFVRRSGTDGSTALALPHPDTGVDLATASAAWIPAELELADAAGQLVAHARAAAEDSTVIDVAKVAEGPLGGATVDYVVELVVGGFSSTTRIILVDVPPRDGDDGAPRRCVLVGSCPTEEYWVLGPLLGAVLSSVRAGAA